MANELVDCKISRSKTKSAAGCQRPRFKPIQPASHLKAQKAEELLHQSDLEKIFSLLRRGKGVDFTDYKHATIKRRILRRMLILKINRMENYLKYLQTNPSELNSLFQ